MNVNSGPGRRTRARAAGFSLVEMMISMLLGLMVLGAAVAVFSSNRASYQANQGLGRVQENARIAFEMMARDLRAAGSTGCPVTAKPEGGSVLTDWWARFPANPVLGYENGALAGSLAETDALEVLSAADAPFGVQAQTASTLTLRSADHPFREDDILVVCDAAKVFVTQATAVNGAVISHTGLTGGYDFFDNAMPSSASVVLAGLVANRWFVRANGRNPSMPNSLYVSRMGAAAEEVAEGVDDLELEYLERGANSYVSAASVGNWGNVVAVRMRMTLSALDPRGTRVERRVENVVSLRTRTL